VPDGLADLIDGLLAADARQSLSLANKAGLVVMGFAKVEATVAAGRAVAIVSASDGGEDGKRKLRQAARRGGGRGAPPLISPFPGRELDLALGRENAIHAALLAGPASNAFLARRLRLDAFRLGGFSEVRPDAGEIPASTGRFALENHPTGIELQDDTLDD
jgi:ribosomal protein L30E